MGALFQGVCYPDIEQAKQAACSAMSATWGAGENVFSIECASTSFTGPTFDVCRRENGGQCSTISYPAPSFPDCDFSGGVDFATEWLYLLLPVMVTLWGIKKLITLFDTNRDDA